MLHGKYRITCCYVAAHLTVSLMAESVASVKPCGRHLRHDCDVLHSLCFKASDNLLPMLGVDRAVLLYVIPARTAQSQVTTLQGCCGLHPCLGPGTTGSLLIVQHTLEMVLITFGVCDLV